MYGYISPEEKESLWVEMPKGQNISGYGIGILHLDDVWYPMMPGNVVNAWTYKFPVRFKAVKGLDTPTLHSGDPKAYEEVLKAARELQQEGVRAIAGACGFFGHFQRRLADDMQIPVGLSSLIQIPWIRSMGKREMKIGILTANASALGQRILASCGIEDADNLVIADLRYGEHFSAIMEDRGIFDHSRVRDEVVAAAKKLVQENPDINVILLECSDMPPYAAAVQNAVKLPVFDFITMINYLNQGTMQRPYDGWI